MEADGLFDLEGMHAQGAEQSLLEIRDALEYYCLKFLRPWLEEYFYQKVGRDFVFSIRSLFVSFALIFVFAGWLFFSSLATAVAMHDKSHFGQDRS